MLRLFAVVAIGASGALGDVPTMPQEYSAVVLMRMPYIPLEMSLRVSTSTTAQKMEYYDGLQVITANQKGTYKFIYNNSARICSFSPPTAGPTQGLRDDPFTPSHFLPDLSKYTQVEDENVGGITCNKFTMSTTHGKIGTMDDHFSFYWDPVLQKPVRWHMHARLVPFDSHTDEYILDYLHFTSGTPGADDLALPQLCIDNPTEARVSDGMRNWLKAAQSPAVASQEFDAYLKQHGKSYDSHEKNMRSGLFAKNMLLVDALNRRHAGIATFKVNQFMDLTKDEVMSYRGGRNKGPSRNRRSAEHQKYVRQHKTVASMDQPKDFDWRSGMPGVVSPVKDQAFCGSCWTYGAIEPIESVLAKQNKGTNLVVLPEQFMLDCTWTNGTGDSGSNSGCDGGDSDIGALEIVRKYQGIIPTAEAYGSYLSVNGYCKDITKMAVGAKLTGWTDIHNPKHDQDQSIMQALYTQGPLSVGIQVPDDMLYYESGVLSVDSCAHNESQIDHAVVATGYGTVPGFLGQPDIDYWTIRNSWSTYWGDKGYINIARGDNDCCVACQAGYPEVAPAAAKSVIV